MRATIATSLNRFFDAGLFIPYEITMLIESSTETPCGTPFCRSISVRLSVGRMSASRPCTRWPRFSFVVMCTVRSQARIASQVRGVSGVVIEKFPPRPMNPFTWPYSIA